MLRHILIWCLFFCVVTGRAPKSSWRAEATWRKGETLQIGGGQLRSSLKCGPVEISWSRALPADAHSAGCSCGEPREIGDWARGQKSRVGSGKARGAPWRIMAHHRSCCKHLFPWPLSVGVWMSLMMFDVCPLFWRKSKSWWSVLPARFNGTLALDSWLWLQMAGMKGERKRCLDYEQSLEPKQNGSKQFLDVKLHEIRWWI